MTDICELRERKHNTPLLSAATESLKDVHSKFGYTHVQKSFGNKYFCNYKGLNTGLRDTPMLAAYELLQMAKKQNVLVSKAPCVEYYPECFANTKVPLEDIAYLKDTSVKAMYKGMTVRVYKGKRLFTCDIVLDGIAYRSHPHENPMEAAYAVHRGKARVKEQVFTPKAEDDIGLPDLEQIAYMQVGSGYKNTYQVAPGVQKFIGRYAVYGQEYKTQIYPTPEMAAWAVHCLTKDVPPLATPPTVKSIKAKLMSEYTIYRRALFEE
jgi:hypothetical protein